MVFRDDTKVKIALLVERLFGEVARMAMSSCCKRFEHGWHTTNHWKLGYPLCTLLMLQLYPPLLENTSMHTFEEKALIARHTGKHPAHNTASAMFQADELPKRDRVCHPCLQLATLVRTPIPFDLPIAPLQTVRKLVFQHIVRSEPCSRRF